jgi:glycosyltransferase involved in cell wall biosynthesis
LFTSQINALNYARAFSATQHQFVIAILVPGRNTEAYEEKLAIFDNIRSPNVTFAPIYLKSGDESLGNILNPFTLLHDLSAVFRTLRKHKPDAVVGMYVIHAYPLAFLKKLLRFTLFTIVSGGDLEMHATFLWRLVRRIVYSNSRAIFTVGHRLQREIEEESGYRAIVVPTGADTDFFRPTDRARIRKSRGYRQDDFVLLTLSRLAAPKRVDDAIRAFKQVKDRHKHNRALKMIIAGQGPEKARLTELCHELRLSHDVKFTGFVGRATKLELFNLANVYVLVSDHEGMPFSLMEAMSCGTVCVCSNVGDIPNLINDSLNGFLITPGNPKLLASRIEEIMDRSEQELSLIARRARQTILDGYDFRKSSKEMLDKIEKSMYRRYSA